MKKTLPNPFLAEATAIGDRLLAGLPQCDTPDILSGISGVFLFLIDLYKQKPDKKYLLAVRNGMDRLDEQKFPPRQKYSLYTGLMGVAYTTIRLYEVSRDGNDLRRAMQIAKISAEEFLNDEITPDTLFDGRAGCLLTLLHLHAASGDKELLLPINQLIRKIIGNMQVAGAGVCWSLTDTNVRAGCGFGAGGSGIAYVFLELGRYFQNSAFYYIAEKAMAYENELWNAEIANWPSYQKELRSAEQFYSHRERFLAGDIPFFAASDDNISYRDGTMGIGLVRARAIQLLNKQVYRDDLTKACQKLSVTYSQTDSFSLGNGKAGYGLFFLEAYKVTCDTAHLAFALRIFQHCLSAGPTNDAGLFSGLAGIGYFYLQISANSPSLFLPDVPGICEKIAGIVSYPFISLGKTGMKAIVLRKIFPRTIYLLEHLAPAHWESYLEEFTEDKGPQDFLHFAKQLIPLVDPGSRDQLWEIFDLESRRMRIAAGITSGAYYHLKSILRMQEADPILYDHQEAFLDVPLTIDEDTTTFQTNLSMIIDEEIPFESSPPPLPAAYTVVLKPSVERLVTRRMPDFKDVTAYRGGQRNIIELHLRGLSGPALTTFGKPRAVGEAIRGVMGQGEHEDPAGAAKMVLRYIRHFLKLGLLKPVPR